LAWQLQRFVRHLQKMPHVDSLEPEDLARLARLRYVSDAQSGFGRQRHGSGFHYLNVRGTRLRDTGHLGRIERLAIPPAWREVWICRFAKGHLQVTGRDSRRRKKYIYHERWREISNLAKFWRLDQFQRSLPALRAAVARDLRQRSLTRRRVLAGCIGLLDATPIRLGNEEYVQENNSYGLTTLRDRHVNLGRHAVELRFSGKGGFRKEAAIESAALMRLIKECRADKGARLFQYTDEEGRRRAITAADVNDYLQEITEQTFTAKDFRTWKASALVAARLYDSRDVNRESQRRRVLKAAVDEAAASLSNTPTICRNYYIHPGLLSSYQNGTFAEHVAQFRLRRGSKLSRDEQALGHFLRRWEAAEGVVDRAG